MSALKKRYLFLIVPSFIIIFLFLIALIGNLESPIKAKKLPKTSKSYRTLSLEQQNKDLEYVKYYFTQHYINYDMMVEKGFDIDDTINQIEKALQKDRRKDGTIESSNFKSALVNTVLKNFNITDNHFSVCGITPEHNIFYFTNVYVKPQSTPDGIKYIVVKNEEEDFPDYIKKNRTNVDTSEIKPGQEYTGSTELLYEWFDGNEKIYRIGIMAKGNINNVFLQIDGKPAKTPVVVPWQLRNQKAQGTIETSETLYISLKNFMFENSSSNNLIYKNKKEFEKLCNNIKEKSKDKKNIIIDLRSNQGGELLRSAMILSNIFYDKKDISPDLYQYLLNQVNDDYTLLSPSTGALYRQSIIPSIKAKFRSKKNKNEKFEMEVAVNEIYHKYNNLQNYCAICQVFGPYRKIEKLPYKKTSVKELPEAVFNGTIYVLTDSYSASCSEYTLALLHFMTRNVNAKICQIGLNTNGAVFYFNPHTVVLPYSGGWFYLPIAINKSENFNNPNFYGEGYGWYPDYWCTNQNILNTLINLSNDKELENKLQGLEISQL